MGRVPAVIPDVLKRRREIRKALSATERDLRSFQGHRGSRRAALLLEARARMCQPTRRTTWDDLPCHLQEMILWQISLRDLENARLAGFGGRDPHARKLVKSLFVERVRALAAVRDCYVVPKHASRVGGNIHFANGTLAKRRFEPFTFTELPRLFLYTGGRRGADGAACVPDAIGEMKSLSRLDVVGDVIKRLPAGLLGCESLQYLCIKGHAFTQVPPVVLRLRKLRQLVIAESPKLECIQEQIGVAMLSLGRLDIRHCPKVRSLPKSLLTRLESSSFKIPLELSPQDWPEGYLRSTITPVLYPRLFSKLLTAYPAHFGQ